MPPDNPQITNSAEDLTELEDKIFLVIKENNKISHSGLSKELNIGSDMIKECLKKLKNKGYLKRVGADNGGFWKIIK